MRINAIGGMITASDADSDGQAFQKRGFSFQTLVGEFSLLAEWDPFGKKRYAVPMQFRKMVTPFIFGGLGAAYFSNDTDFGSNGDPDRDDIDADKRGDYPHVRPSLPVGMGLKFDLSRKTTLAATLSTHYTFTDFLDGVSNSGNPGTNDWLWFGGLQLSFRFAAKDSDGDGIADKEDACPRLAGDPSARGCPDMDGDGLEDAEDVCPEIAGLLRHNGCPDSDGDDIMDLIDQCPNAFGYEATGGCPDMDDDCIADADDRCPEVAGLPEFHGCPDTDHDGIPDNLDPCPTDAGLAENGGCPLPDSDCDGIIDADDPCPLAESVNSLTGCPDTDEDGIVDRDDTCPEEPGLPDNGGCPELEETEKELITNARTSIQFRTGSAVLLPASKLVLDEIVELMRKYPYYSLSIEGHTDSQGNDESNLRLSQRRAKSCYDYLTYRGISPGRLSYEGYGETQPIADNKTSKGRSLNRRVEFIMFIPEEG